MRFSLGILSFGEVFKHIEPWIRPYIELALDVLFRLRRHPEIEESAEMVSVPLDWFQPLSEPVFGHNEQHAPIAQLFIMFKERDRNTELTVERLRSCFRAAQCRPGFYFQDGRVLFLHSTEPGSMILRRCEHHIKTLSASIVCDAESDTYSIRGFEPKAWELIDLEELGFVA